MHPVFYNYFLKFIILKFYYIHKFYGCKNIKKHNTFVQETSAESRLFF